MFFIGDHVRVNYPRSKKSHARTGYVGGVIGKSVVFSADDDGHELRFPVEWLEKIDSPPRRFRVVFNPEGPGRDFGSANVYADDALIHTIAFLSRSAATTFAIARNTTLEG